MSEWSFSNLNLTGVAPQRGSIRLPVGRHICKTANMKAERVGNGLMLSFDLIEVNGAGKTEDRVWVAHKNSQAEEIGRSRLKALLTFGAFPDPDMADPSSRDVKKLNNLIVGVNVAPTEDWVDEKGVTRRGAAKPARDGAYFDPAELGYERPAEVVPVPGTSTLDDEIPF